MNNGISHYNLIQDANPAYIIYLPDFYQIDNPPVKMLKKSYSLIQQNEMSVTSWNYQSLNIRSDPQPFAIYPIISTGPFCPIEASSTYLTAVILYILDPKE